MIAAIIIIIVLIAAVCAVSFTFFKVCSAREVSGIAGHVIKDASPDFSGFFPAIEDGINYWTNSNPQPVEIKSYDGLTLRGAYLQCKNPRRNIICVHGYRAEGLSSFATALPELISMGSNILLIDQRACGKSDGKYICFGMKERYDLLSWAEWLSKTTDGGLPTYLDGVSLGGTTVLMASDLKLPHCVCGIIDDCGYTSPKEIIRYIIKNYMPRPMLLMLPFINLTSRIVTGLWLTDVDTRDCVKRTKIPIAFVHGAKDRFVPVQMGKENFDACASKKVMYISENAEHGTSFLENKNECMELLRSFFADCEK